MNKDDISALVRFNFWADDQILSACERVSIDEFTRPHSPDPGWGSLRGILVHALDTEYGWRSALQSLDDDHILDEHDFADVASLKVRWDEERRAWLDYVDTLTDDTLGDAYNDDNQDSPKVWQIVVHVVSHGIQHRSEAATILTGYGHAPGELDFLVFLKLNPQFL